MNSGLKYFLGFVVGVGVGVSASMTYFKKKYETAADKEIESMKAYYKKKEAEVKPISGELRHTTTVIHDKLAENEGLKIGWKNPIENEPPSKLPDYGHMFKNKETIEPPYVITPDEYYDEISYTKITLTYYGIDKILADDDGYMVENVNDIVGSDWETRFGEYAEGVVYVRNNAQQTDYEILYTDARFVGD